MKHILFFFTSICLISVVSAQINSIPEKRVEIASIENEQAEFKEFSPSDIKLTSNISRSFRLEKESITLLYPVLLKNSTTNEWYLQYEFFTPEYRGIYRENLVLKEDQLMITESRIARLAIASNCDEIKFINDGNSCECTLKKNNSEDSEVTFRAFTSNM